ncbi:MAG: hypothetical protein ACKOE9_06390 [Vulcanococcus sp.]
MHVLSDSKAEQFWGGQPTPKAGGFGAIRESIRLGVRQMNMAVNIIIGSGSISNTQINLLDAGLSL